MKKLMAMLCAAALMVSTSVCVFAQPSKEIDVDVDFDTDVDNDDTDNDTDGDVTGDESTSDSTSSSDANSSTSSTSTSTTTTTDGVSPKTGEMAVELYAGMIAMVSLAGMSVVVYNRKRA